MNHFQNCKTDQQAKKHFYKMSFQLHPDRPGGSTQEFQELNRQYEEFKNKNLPSQGEEKQTKQKNKYASFIDLINDPQFNDLFKIVEQSTGFNKAQILHFIQQPGIFNLFAKELVLNFINKKL